MRVSARVGIGLVGACACAGSTPTNERLERLGNTDVRVRRAGIEDWIRSGLPIETMETGGNRRNAKGGN